MLIATASTTVRNKNLIMIAMCLVFLGLFGYDAFWGYPKKNDALVAQMLRNAKAAQEDPAKGNGLKADDLTVLSRWPAPPGGWNEAPTSLRDEFTLEFRDHRHLAEGWKSSPDIFVQQICAGFLVLANGAAIAWFLRCQKRRVTADDMMLSPEPGVAIPWVNITKVDNLQWKKKGIVTLEYCDAAGAPQSELLDDYLVDNLVPILEMLAQKADKAEFVNPPEAAAAK